MSFQMWCRSCNSAKITPVFSLGNLPLANALVSEEDLDKPDELFPLDLVFCEECALLQLKEAVPPEKLFKNYLYQSSYSLATVEDRKKLTAQIANDMQLGPEDLVVDIGSNDGSLLENYIGKGIQVLGVDPAENLMAISEARGVSVLRSFFNSDVAMRYKTAGGMVPRVIHAHNVLAHNPHPNTVIKGIKILLHPSGLCVIDVPYVRNLIDGCEFDTIYHEHVFYFSVTALKALVERNGLQLSSVERIGQHGGSLRLCINHSGYLPTDASVQIFLQEEKSTVCKIEYYQDFAQKCEIVKDRLLTLFSGVQHLTIAGFGAPAKATTLLNYCGIKLPYTVDDTPTKQGKWIPGVRVPIYPFEKLVEDRPDRVLILCWNMEEEALKRLEPWFPFGHPDHCKCLPLLWRRDMMKGLESKCQKQ